MVTYLEELIRNRARFVADFPKAGINFVDIFPLVEDSAMLDLLVAAFAVHNRALRPTKIVALEARGFIFGPLLAKALGVGFVPVRKPGKLPPPVISQNAQTEYSSVTLEMASNSLTPNDSVVILDDILATGGTARATASLVQQMGAKVAGFSFVGEIKGVARPDELALIAPVQILVQF